MEIDSTVPADLEAKEADMKAHAEVTELSLNQRSSPMNGISFLASQIRVMAKESDRLFANQMRAVHQLGELLDEASTQLQETREGLDLKAVSALLKLQFRYSPKFVFADFQKYFAQLGGRYGIASAGGSPYALDRLIQIAEQALVRSALIREEQGEIQSPDKLPPAYSKLGRFSMLRAA